MTAIPITVHRGAIDASVDHEIRAIVSGTEAGSTCSPDLAASPWTFDERPGYGPGASMGDVIPAGAPRQGGLPAEYREASEEDLDRRIRAAKDVLGERVVVLGHFYQREEIIRHADYVGDSFQLAGAATVAGVGGELAACGATTGAASGPVVEMGALSVFTPARLTIKVGQTVTWRNTSNIVHTATADPKKLVKPENARLPEGVAPWDSGSILAGKTWSHTFDVAGEYRYACVPHEIAGMIGVIIVEG